MSLHRRLTVLEAAADRQRRHHIAELVLAMPEMQGLSAEATSEAVEEALRCLDRIRAWERQGLDSHEIVRREAELIGSDPDAFVADYERFLRGPA